jgi:NADP-dependent 3-hydroxy acid dehydrogenase YdfG
MNYWQQKNVFITGASSGIGAALAVELGKRGARIALLARRADELQKIAAEIEKANGEALPLACDVRDAEAVREAVRQAQARFGAIDILIANAGVGGSAAVENLRAADVERVIAVNFLGAVNSVIAVLPQMLERRSGQLVAISSLAGSRGLPKSAAYCASKAAMSAFFESLRVDLRGNGIAVTTIYPGFIKTPLTAGRQAKMPFLLELDDATQRIIRAIETRRRSYWFPFPLSTLVRAMRFTPDAVYDFLIGRASYRE